MRWSGRRLRGFGSLCTGRVSETGCEKGWEDGRSSQGKESLGYVEKAEEWEGQAVLGQFKRIFES